MARPHAIWQDQYYMGPMSSPSKQAVPYTIVEYLLVYLPARSMDRLCIVWLEYGYIVSLTKNEHSQ